MTLKISLLIINCIFYIGWFVYEIVKSKKINNNYNIFELIVHGIFVIFLVVCSIMAVCKFLNDSIISDIAMYRVVMATFVIQGLFIYILTIRKKNNVDKR